MLLVIDAGLGEAGRAAAEPLRQAFGPTLVPFAAPAEEPDAGLLAAIQAGPATALVGSTPTPWLARLGLPMVEVDADRDLVAAVATRLGPKVEAPAPKPARVAFLPADALRQGLDGLGLNWRMEIVPGSAACGLVVELVRRFDAPSYLAAADLARSIADVAEAEDHHPTLIHGYRTLEIRVTTGEAGKRLTGRDLGFAAAVDRCVEDHAPAA